MSRLAAECGVKAITIHGRYMQDRPRHAALPGLCKLVAEEFRRFYPEIAIIWNGDIFVKEDIQRLKEESGADVQ